MFTKLIKKNCIASSVFGYENKKKNQIYVSKNTSKMYLDLFLIGEECNMNCVLIKDFNTFIHYIVEEDIFVDIQQKF